MLEISGSLCDGRNDKNMPGIVMTMALELARHKPGYYYKKIVFGDIKEEDDNFSVNFKSLIGTGKKFENENTRILYGTVFLLTARDESASNSAVFLNLN